MGAAGERRALTLPSGIFNVLALSGAARLGPGIGRSARRSLKEHATRTSTRRLVHTTFSQPFAKPRLASLMEGKATSLLLDVLFSEIANRITFFRAFRRK